MNTNYVVVPTPITQRSRQRREQTLFVELVRVGASVSGFQ
jgi:hypothetical protein